MILWSTPSHTRGRSDVCGVPMGSPAQIIRYARHCPPRRPKAAYGGNSNPPFERASCIDTVTAVLGRAHSGADPEV